MTITQGKEHKYLNMIIDYSLPDKVILYIMDFIVKMLGNIP